MSRKLKLALGLSAAVIAASAAAREGSKAVANVATLNHVFVVMMENHGYGQIIGNPNAPFINNLAAQANLATNYFAIGHPSLPNYLEVAGGSNFGVRADDQPDWHNTSCQPNLATGAVNTTRPASGNICPIAGTGTDAATPAVDCTNQYIAPNCGNDIDGVQGYAADTNITGKTIADQLVSAGMTIKVYEENMPPHGPDQVDYSDGLYSNLTDFTKITPTLNPPLTSADIESLYVARHNPFVYFANVQTGTGPVLYSNMVDFGGANGLYADLANGKSPTYSFIVPNICHDMHGEGNAGAFCAGDPDDNGTQAGLNPALIRNGDQAVKNIMTAIAASPVWSNGRTAVFVLWDENDYSQQPNVNKVAMIVNANYGAHGLQSNVYYNHFSLLKTIEGALGLPCLNHACDAGTAAMTDLLVSP